MKRKSLALWWSALTEELGFLWVNNLLYLLCIAPGLICAFLFFFFQAYLFLALFALGLVLAGPGIMAVHKTALDAAQQKAKHLRSGFFSAYREYFLRGILLGTVLAAAATVLGLPVIFALSLGFSIGGVLVFSLCMWLLFWFSSSSQLLYVLCTRKKPALRELLGEVFAPGYVALIFGLVKLGWLLLWLLAPVFALSCALAGLPTVIRYTILRYLYN